MFVGNKLKKLRLSKGLSQEAFAKKFFVKENTISNYENAIRTPSIEFLMQVCKEFGLTLDYFEDKECIESDPSNLVVTKKNDKAAIFDTKQSCYLTPHIYQYINLSKYGHHLVFNRNQEGEISYSAMVDNFGKVTEYPGIALGNNGGFDKFGNICGYCKKLNGIVLMNYKGEILSGAYNRIFKINTIEQAKHDEDYGLYFGFLADENHNLYIKDLLDVNGKIINLTLTENILSKYEIQEFNDFDKLSECIDDYGIGMIYFIPQKLFKAKEVYSILFDYCCVKAQTCADKNVIDDIVEIVEFLASKQKMYNVRLANKDKATLLLSNLDKTNINRITLALTKQKLENLFNSLFS